jgi:Flp pilus assembly protein TadG
MSRRLKSPIESIDDYVSSEQAVTAVEFAMLAPAFMGITFMILQIGLYEMYSASLSYATKNAARQIMIGNVANTPNITTTTFMNTFVCPNLPPMMSCGQVVVNAVTMPSGSSWWSLMNAQQTGLAPPPMNNALTSFCIGGTGSTVALEMYYAMPTISFPYFNTPTNTYNGNPVIWIASTAAFRNEPFTTSYTGC